MLPKSTRARERRLRFGKQVTQTLPVIDTVLREAERYSLLSAVGSAGQYPRCLLSLASWW
jgi:hypothetical protein